MKVKFKEWGYDVEFHKYLNGNTAIILTTPEKEPIATATVNVPEAKLAPDEVIIKDYSENKGMLDALINAGIVKDLGSRIRVGYVTVPICKLLVDPNEQ